MLIFHRPGWSVEVNPLTWAEIVEFFSEAGWEPNIPTQRLLIASSITVDEESALAFAEAGKVVLEETRNDPLAACSAIQFDLGKFAEIVEFASVGSFSVTQRQ